MNQLTLTECSKRRLDETYIVVYAIKNEINIKKGDYIEKSDIYTLIGNESIKEKINNVATKVYGAIGVKYSKEAEEKIVEIENLDSGNYRYV